MQQKRTSRWYWLSTAFLAALALVVVACGADEAEEAAPETEEQPEEEAPEETEPEAEEEAEAEPEEEDTFYESGTIRFIVPYNPGGGYDTYARAIAPYIEANLPGAQVVVENVPGAGGLVGANEVYNAGDEGDTIGIINFPGAVFAEASGEPGAEMVNTDWSFLGRVTEGHQLFYVRNNDPHDTLEDIANSDVEWRWGLGGVGSDGYYTAVVMSEVLGIDYNTVTGYDGSGEADGALIADEVDINYYSVGSAIPLVESGEAKPIAYMGTDRHPDLPDVPTALEAAPSGTEGDLEALAALYDLYRVLVAAPGIPEARLDVLRQAVEDALLDPELNETLEAEGRDYDPLGGLEAEETASTSVFPQLDQLVSFITEASN